MNRMRKKSGFSIAEAVVALAVIVIVSIGSVSVVSGSITARANAINNTKAQNFADNLLECFKVSENPNDFRLKVNFAEGVALVYTDTDGKTYETYTYENIRNNFKAEITVKFPESERPSFEIDVTNLDGDKSIISFSYVKGD